jgi:hypothetical protein
MGNILCKNYRCFCWQQLQSELGWQLPMLRPVGLHLLATSTLHLFGIWFRISSAISSAWRAAPHLNSRPRSLLAVPNNTYVLWNCFQDPTEKLFWNYLKKLVKFAFSTPSFCMSPGNVYYILFMNITPNYSRHSVPCKESWFRSAVASEAENWVDFHSARR